MVKWAKMGPKGPIGTPGPPLWFKCSGRRQFNFKIGYKQLNLYKTIIGRDLGITGLNRSPTLIILGHACMKIFSSGNQVGFQVGFLYEINKEIKPISSSFKRISGN